MKNIIKYAVAPLTVLALCVGGSSIAAPPAVTNAQVHDIVVNKCNQDFHSAKKRNACYKYVGKTVASKRDAGQTVKAIMGIVGTIAESLGPILSGFGKK